MKPKRILIRDLHGTSTCYRAGCRCALCKRAISRKALRWRSTKSGADVPKDKHGTKSAYVNYNCRCRDCTYANTLYGQVQRAKRMNREDKGEINAT